MARPHVAGPAAPRPFARPRPRLRLTPETRMAMDAAVLISLGPLSLTLLGPSLPAIAGAFQVHEDALAAAMTLYLAGFAAGQLVCGPLSDRYGRRPVTLAFLLLYLAGTALAMAAVSPTLLIAGRVVQGVGAAVGMTVARAMVRDRFHGQAGARVLSRVAIVVSTGPALAPLLGTALMGVGTWHWLFAAMGAYALVLLTGAVARLPETATAAPADRQDLRPGAVLRTYRDLACDARFLMPALTASLALGGLYTFITALPFALAEVAGLSAMEIGPIMAAPAVTYFIGAAASSRLLRALPAARLMLWGALLLAMAGAVAAAVPLLPTAPTPALLVAPAMIWSLGMAMVIPGASSGALAAFPRTAGAAAALLGCLQMATGMVGGALTTTAAPDAVTGLAVVPLLMGLAVVALRLRER